MKHTPAPWFVTESSDWTGMSGVSLGIDDAEGQDGGRDYHLATVVHGDPDELKANAVLIAAAPELLNALKALLTESEYSFRSSGFPAFMQGSVSKARAAIAKAGGAA